MSILDAKIKILDYLEEAEKYGFSYGIGRDILMDYYDIETKTKDIHIFNMAIYQLTVEHVICKTSWGYYKINRDRR